MATKTASKTAAKAPAPAKKAAAPAKKAAAAAKPSLTKAEFVETIAKDFELSKARAGDVLDLLVETIKKQTKKSGSFTLHGLGTFKVVKRAARKGRNPRTGEEVKIKASKTVRFQPSPKFKESL